MNINASNLCAQYSTYKVNVDNVKQKMDEVAVNDGVYEAPAATMELSPEGKALAGKKREIMQPEIDDAIRAKVQESANAESQIEAYRLTTKNTNEVMWEHYMDMRAFKAEAFDHNAEYDEEDIMQSITDAYAAVYQKILKAHENGDREVDYEFIGKSKISLEEDLAGLDAAFERCVADLEGYLTCKRTNEMFANPDMAWWFERNNRKISTDLNYNFILSDKINSLNEADKDISESGRLSGRDRLENIAEAYITLYDEIAKGYEEGTRFIVVADNNKQSGYHVLTMEEELAALDEAYGKAVNNTVAIINQGFEVHEAFEKYYAKLQKIGADRAELANEYAAQDRNTDVLPKDAVDRMMNAQNVWKNIYNTSSKNVAWQRIMFVINNLFQ